MSDKLPVGTPCILVYDNRYPPIKSELLGVYCVVNTHSIPESNARRSGADHGVEIRDFGNGYVRRTSLLPLNGYKPAEHETKIDVTV